jgi:small-conductance mechanosensitive channel
MNGVSSMRERLLELLGYEPLILLTFVAFGVYFIYKIFLRNASPQRHINLRKLFRELFTTYVLFVFAWVGQYLIQKQFVVLDPFFHYFAIATVIFGAVLMVRSVKILVFEYLFLNSMNVGVPVLLVNLVTLIFSIFIAAWLSTSVFGVRWAPLLATSAFVSVVLGLALQDTLGNLFAGVALQFDKPYEIGDWIEVHGDQVFTGEVHEVTWRATTLFGLFDEVITLPNRLVGQSQISNFSARKKPVYRGLSIYLDARADEEKVKQIFVQVLKDTPGVLQNLQHYIMIRDLTEKGIHWRLFYPIVHYSKQFTIVDEILMRTQVSMKKAQIEISRLRVDVGNHANPAEFPS